MKRLRSLLFTLIALCLLGMPLLLVGPARLRAQEMDYPHLFTQAEQRFAEKSYTLAHDLYARTTAMKLTAAEARWVAFRLADTQWRAQAATQNADTTKIDAARQALEDQLRLITREEDHDQTWAEIHESLGDFFWTRSNMRDWSSGWAHYEPALKWWAGSRDIELARGRYLHIVWKLVQPEWMGRDYFYYGYANNIPLEVLENAAQIAVTTPDKARAHLLLAQALTNRGGAWNQQQRIPKEYELALQGGKAENPDYDAALYNYAQWLQSPGPAVMTAIRTDPHRPVRWEWRRQPDYPKALALLRRLLAEYRQGESRFWEGAQGQVNNIVNPSLNVSVSNIFVPGSEIQYYVNWRNIKHLDFTLYQVDLLKNTHFTTGNQNGNDWINSVSLTDANQQATWTKETEEKGDYVPGQACWRLEQKLASGAYLLVAKGAGTSARELVLVTDGALVLKSAGKQALVYAANTEDSTPLPQVPVALWEGYWVKDHVEWSRQDGETNADGLAPFTLQHAVNSTQLFAIAGGARPAYVTGYHNWHGDQQDAWRIYAFTDRPAYRPGETAQWKLIARRYHESAYSTPAGQAIEYEITDPRGTKVTAGKSTLNDFGSAWGALPLTAAMPLGEYRVNCWEAGRRQYSGQAVLFRLEEYKLPEFKVSVHTPEEQGRRKLYRLGDQVEVNIQADYYYGAPVANAAVEVLVTQRAYYHFWMPPHDYPWYYDEANARNQYYGGDGAVIKRETLKTDATGKAKLTFDSASGEQDMEYRIEARVTDSSRREIIGNDSVRVTRQRYFVHPYTDHHIYHPQDPVTVKIKALDANAQPVQTAGTVTVTRDTWVDRWIDPLGHPVRVEGGGLPRGVDSQHPWRLRSRGYEHEEILTRTVKTNAEGVGDLTFTPGREGYFHIAWASEDAGGPPVEATTDIWVCTHATNELGYRHGGIQIIVDADTFRAGQTAPVMLTSPVSDRYVLFSVEADNLLSYQVVHLTGTAKLVQLPITEQFVPNIFLGAAMISDRQFFTDSQPVVVPPAEHFLTVEVKPDRLQYQPREKGNLTVTTRDADGKPVAAEVALGLVDESVYYIQQDYAGDPRQAFFGQKRSQGVQTQSSMNQKSYALLKEDDSGQLTDVRDMRSMDITDSEKDERMPLDIVSSSGDGVYQFAVTSATAAPAGPQGSMGGRRRENFSKDASEQESTDRRALQAANGVQGPKPGENEPAVVVRSDFRSTIHWQPDVMTGKDGTAVVPVTYPDLLTGWKATARVVTTGSQFGIGEVTTRTKQPLIVRLEAPRFFVVGDTATISAVIDNNTGAPLVVKPQLVSAQLKVNGQVKDGKVNPLVVKALGAYPLAAITVPATGEARVDWEVAATSAGTAKLEVSAKGDQYADAMEKSYPVYEHGIDKTLVKAGKVTSHAVKITIDLPKARKVESTEMSVQVTPSLAVTMLDALPYLKGYPYEHTEATMSRFLPLVITAKTLKDLGVSPEAIAGKVFGGVEGEYAGKTHPDGKQDLTRMNELIAENLAKLYDFQHGDGGWAWWKETPESDPYMTAYVLWGLSLARDAGVGVTPNVLQRAADYLDKKLVDYQETYDMQAWLLHALAAYHAPQQAVANDFEGKAFDNLYNHREKLNAYTRALLAWSAQAFGKTAQAQVLARNLIDGVIEDKTPDVSVVMEGAQSSHAGVIGTAHWGSDGFYWRWSDGGVEATAFALRALLAIDPKSPLIAPVTNWLIKNRRGAQWNNTHDTAIVVLALNDYLRVSGELAGGVQYTLLVNGHQIADKHLTAQDVLAAPTRYAIDRQYLHDGANEITLRRGGKDGALYFSVQAHYFSLEEPIPPAGHELFVRRTYYKLVGRPTLLNGYVYDKVPLHDGEAVTSGERVQVVVNIEAKNDYDYLRFEDLKPAGLEAVEVRSGEPLYTRELKSGAVDRTFVAGKTDREAADYTGRTRWVYRELRDRQLALFIDHLPQGTWELRYDLRAEVPGHYHALPLLGQAQYTPEVRCNGTEVRLTVVDKE